jgi:hypothetical protein
MGIPTDKAGQVRSKYLQRRGNHEEQARQPGLAQQQARYQDQSQGQSLREVAKVRQRLQKPGECGGRLARATECQSLMRFPPVARAAEAARQSSLPESKAANSRPVGQAGKQKNEKQECYVGDPIT